MMNESDEVVKENILSVFSSVADMEDMEELLKELQDTMLKTADEKQSFKQFIQCLKPVLMKPKESSEADKILLFVAQFAKKLYESYCVANNIDEDSSDSNMHPFVDGLVGFLLEALLSINTTVRFRACFLLKGLMLALFTQRYINEKLCEKISAQLMKYMLDRNSMVRSQACECIYLLQDRSDPCCKYTKELLFLMKRDVAATVRQTILQLLPITETTIPDILLRLRDVSPKVRLRACILLADASVKILTLEQRNVLIRSTLQDEHEPVRKYAAEHLLPGWLRQMDNSLLLLLSVLGVEKCPNLATLVLDTLLSTLPLETMTQDLLGIQQARTVCVEKLSPETAVYWHRVARHFIQEKMDDEWENIVPELTLFTQYIRRCFVGPEALMTKSSTSYESQQSVLWQLLQIVALYDLADEYGRRNLSSLIQDLMLLPLVSGEQLVTFVCQLLHKVEPTVDLRVNIVDNVVRSVQSPLVPLHSTTVDAISRLLMDVASCDRGIADLQQKAAQQNAAAREVLRRKMDDLVAERARVLERAPEAMDASRLNRDSITKCIDMVYGLVLTLQHEVPLPVVRLLHYYVRPVFWVRDTQVGVAALRALAACCMLDLSLAKTHWKDFLKFMVFNEATEVNLTALKALFDLMLVHKIEVFHMDPNYSESGETRNIAVFAGLLDEDQGRRLVAAQGLWKLLLARRLESPALLSRLIVLYYSPLTENDAHLRQLLSIYLHKFATQRAWAPEVLQQAFMGTLRVFFSAPASSPLACVEVSKVAELLVSLTNPDVNTLTQVNIHNEMAKSLCEEALTARNQDHILVVLRTLLSLKLDLEKQQELQEYLQRLALELVQKLQNASMHNLAVAFQNKVKQTD